MQKNIDIKPHNAVAAVKRFVVSYPPLHRAFFACHFAAALAANA
jgi:hypothetical protein